MVITSLVKRWRTTGGWGWRRCKGFDVVSVAVVEGGDAALGPSERQESSGRI